MQRNKVHGCLREESGHFFADPPGPSSTVAGETVRRSTGETTKRLAREYEDDLRQKLKDRVRNGQRIWQEAAIRWLQDNEHKKSLQRDKDALKWALPYLKDMRLADINRDVLDELRKTKAAETSKSNANRTMAVIRSILRKRQINRVLFI